MRVIIAAAGTAGHINPGIAIANKIKQEEKDSKIIFIGTTRGLENDFVISPYSTFLSLEDSHRLGIENLEWLEYEGAVRKIWIL